ncbi:hypothetical protein BmR1_04g07385 [Babesia microti strain RI]|uniref:Uncharacterized protein n=1 Tax=Babesia microti (strain RI) TaxID=1133968 RepID=A0A1N6LXY0_BABMR|nr:hypothetical protein BmR1_04g07385 [Babesia microti strain RI]SIO73739.1 hypothetical protein BmR1_04g07385 [Babesia microti strain RI]|eukprot:XP_021337802.1 hypothetical protein BmR1_04g07385 [Babesia microti strain RI]
MEEKVDKVEAPTESTYSKISEWLMSKLESSLNALYLVSASRVQSDLAEKAVTLNDKTGVSDKNSKPDTSDELRLSDLEDVFQKLSIITPPKEPTIVNDFNFIEKLDTAENNKQLYDQLTVEHEKLLKKKDKLLDTALSGSKDKFNTNFAKILENVRKERIACEEHENDCKAYIATTKLLNDMCNITCESCNDMGENSEIVQPKSIHSDIVTRDVSSIVSGNSTRDGLSI